MVKYKDGTIYCIGKSRKKDWMKVRAGRFESAYIDENYLYSKTLLIEIYSRSENIYYVERDGKIRPVSFEFLAHWIKQLEDEKMQEAD